MIHIDIGAGVQTFREFPVRAERVQNRLTHPGHDAHVQGDVDGIRQFDSDLGKRRSNGTHRERNDPQRPTLHGTFEELPGFRVAVLWRHPIVRWAGVFLVLRADKGQVFGPSHVVGVRAAIKGTGVFFLIQGDQETARDGALFKAFARALRVACSKDKQLGRMLPSTKGLL